MKTNKTARAKRLMTLVMAALMVLQTPAQSTAQMLSTSAPESAVREVPTVDAQAEAKGDSDSLQNDETDTAAVTETSEVLASDEAAAAAGISASEAEEKTEDTEDLAALDEILTAGGEGDDTQEKNAAAAADGSGSKAKDTKDGSAAEADAPAAEDGRSGGGQGSVGTGDGSVDADNAGMSGGLADDAAAEDVTGAEKRGSDGKPETDAKERQISEGAGSGSANGASKDTLKESESETEEETNENEKGQAEDDRTEDVTAQEISEAQGVYGQEDGAKADAVSDMSADGSEPDGDAASENEDTEQETETEATMPAQSFTGRTTRVNVTARAEEGIFPEGTQMRLTDVGLEQVRAAADAVTDGEVVDAIAVDITFFDPNGNEIQPAGGIKVSLFLNTPVAGETREVIHIDDEGTAELIDETHVTAKAASFEADSFSVYAIIGTGGKQAGDTTRRTYIFKVEDEEVSRQTVKNGDTLIEPATPVAHEADNYFIGWFLENGSEMNFGTVSGIADAASDEEVVVNARFFEEFTVTFYGKVIDGQRPILEIETGDTGDTVSTAGITPQALSGSEELIGWSEDENATEATYGLNDTITIADYDMSLYPVIRSVRKIEFDGNGDGDHVTFTAPLTVIPGSTATQPENPERTGYTFTGWYTEADCTNPFDWNQPIAAGDEPILLYAGWSAETVQYEVYVWGEVMNDDGTSEYAVEKSYFGTATAGTEFTEAMITASYNANITSDVFDNNYYTYNSEKTDAQYGTKVKGDGSSIFNIYYDLKEFEFYFVPGQNTAYTITVGGITYSKTANTKATNYSFKAKLGQNLDNLWPTAVTYSGNYSNYVHTGWQFTRNNQWGTGGVNPVWVSDRHTLTKQSINKDSSGVPYATTYFKSRAIAKSSTTTANFLFYLENEDGTYPNDPDERFSQRNATVESSSVDAQKEIAGYEFDRLVKSGSTYNYYYKRSSYDINFHNYNVEDPGGATDIKFGSDISSYNHTPNKDATGLEDYYEFQGWYTDRQYQNEWTFTGEQAKMPSHNLTLYAYWKAKDITITLDKGDGTTETITTTAGSTIEEPTAEREGLIFDGWYIGSTKVDFENRVFENDVTLTARWISGQVYKVRYDDEYEDHPKAQDDNEYRLGSHILVLAPSDDTHETGTFHGYRLRGQSNGAIYTPGYILSFDSLDLLDDEGYITFDAVHTEAIPQVKIIYHANGGTGADVETAVQTRNEEFTALPEGTFTRTGYEFLGWAKSASATVEDFEAGDSISADTKGATQDEDGVYVNHLYAVWKTGKADYTITHYLEKIDGSGWDIPEGGQYTRNDTVGNTVTAVSRYFTGFTFDEGNADNVLSGDVLADGTLGLKLYYKRNSGFTVTYQYEGSVPSDAPAAPTDSTTYKYGQTVSVADTITEQDIPSGYSFSGWYTKRITIADGKFTMPNYAVVVYGRFTPDEDGSTFTITHYGEITDGSTPAVTVDGVGFKVLDSYTRNGTAGETGTAQYLTRFEGYTKDETVSATVTSGSITGNGSLELKLFYKANANDVVYHYTGTVPSGAPEVPATVQHKFNENVSFEAKPTLAGYDFDGWKKPDGSDLVVTGDTFKMPNRPVEIVGSWKARSDTKYRVTHYIEELDGSWSVKETYENEADTDSIYTAVPRSYTGFTFDATVDGTVQSGAVSATDELELKLYYTRNSYTVNIYSRSGKPEGGKSIDEARVEGGYPMTAKYGETVTVYNAPEVSGYTFYGWYGDTDADPSTGVDTKAPENKYSSDGEEKVGNGGTFVMPAANVSLFAAYEGEDDVTYTINHYLQKSGTTDTRDKNNYDLKFSESGNGKTDTIAYAQPIDTYVGHGYTYNHDLTTHATPTDEVPDIEAAESYNATLYKTGGSIVVHHDGSSVIDIYYMRDQYTVTYVFNNTAPRQSAKPADEIHYFEETVTVADKATAPGYTFDGWKYEDTIITSLTMPSSDVTLYGAFVPATDTSYKVQYYGENLAGDGYDLLSEDTSLSGTTGETATATVLTFDGFTYDSENNNNVISGAIAGDGTTVLKVYYKRNTYKLSYQYEGYVPTTADPESGDLPTEVEYKYGQEVTPEAGATATGYTFSGWDLSELTEENGKYYMPAEDETITGHFTAVPSGVTYIVNHYGEALPSDTDTVEFNGKKYVLIHGDELPGTANTDTTESADTFDGFTYDKSATSSAAPSGQTVNDERITGRVLANPPLVMNFLYKRNTYTVTYVYEGTIPADAPAVPEVKEYTYGETVTLKDDAVLAGYDFIKWHTLSNPSEGDHIDVVDGKFDMPARKVTIVGQFVARNDTKYRVTHHLEKVDSSNPDNYEVPDGDAYDYERNNGTTGETYTARPLTLDGFTLDTSVEGTKQSGTITASPELHLHLYYSRNKYDVTYEVINPPSGYTVPEGEENVPYGKEGVSIKAKPDVLGYDFDGWNTDVSGIDASAGSFTMPATDVKFTGTFTPKTDIAYKVEHYVEGLDGTTDYELIETEDKTGTTGTEVTADAKDYSAKGYVQDTSKTSDMTGTIAGDGNTVLKVYYKRNSYKVTYSYENTPSGASTLPETKTYKVGETVSLEPDASAPGYTFDGWHTLENPTTGSKVEIVDGKFEMPGRDVSILGKFTANNDTEYKVEWYYQKDNGDISDTADKSETRTGTSDTTADATDADKTPTKGGYVFVESISVVSGRIAGNGSLVLRLYFKADKNKDGEGNGIPDDEEEYTVLYKKGDHGTFAEDEEDKTSFAGLSLGQETPEYAGETDSTKDDKPQGETGWVFAGWNPEVADTIRAEDSDKNAVITYTATWKEDKNNNGIADDAEAFTVIYKDEEGTELKKLENLSAGDTLDAYTPEKTDYVFDKWTPDWKAAVDAADANADSEIIYTASWREDKNNNGIPDEDEEFIVAYTDGVEGTVVFEDQRTTGLKQGDPTPAFAGSPERADFVLAGWTPAVAKTVQAANADAHSVILYTATWKDDKNNNGIADDEELFTVIFKDADGTEYDRQTGLKLGAAVSAPADPTKTDYLFDSWDPEVAAEVKAEDSVAPESGAGEWEILYTATWKDDKNNNGVPDDEEYRLIVYKDGVRGTVFTDVAFTRQLDGLDTPAFGADPTRTDYVFAGWNPVVAEKINGNATYTATWKEDKNHNKTPDEDESFPITYPDADKDEDGDGQPDEVTEEVPYGTEIVVDPNGGTWRGSTDPVTLIAGEDPEGIDLTDAPSRDGYVFGGWERENRPDGSHTFTARWIIEETPEPAPERSRYSVTYDPNGGSWSDGSTQTRVEEYDEGTVITIADAPVREGYTFQYWQGSAYQPGDSYEVTENHTFTAIWTENRDEEPTPEPEPEPEPEPISAPDDPAPEQPAVDNGQAAPPAEKASKTAVATVRAPKTSDSNNIWLWLVLFAAAIVGIGGVWYANRDKKKRK